MYIKNLLERPMNQSITDPDPSKIKAVPKSGCFKISKKLKPIIASGTL